MATNGDINSSFLLFQTPCSGCDRTVQLTLSTTVSRVADKTGGRWVECAECGHINFAEQADPAEAMA